MGASAILAAVRAVVPSVYGSARFRLLTGGSWGPGGGTTCAFLCAWCLYFAGCRDPRIVNYEAPATGLRFHVSEGISRLIDGARTLGALDTTAARFRPLPGDFLFLTEGPPHTEHVEVFLGFTKSGAWRVAAAGQTDPKTGRQCAIVKTRTRRGSQLTTAAGGRTLAAVIRTRRLPYAAAPLGGGSALVPLLFLAALGVAALE